MYIKNEDTICAPATVPGTGAISVIRVSGPEALSIADKVISCRKGTIADVFHIEQRTHWKRLAICTPIFAAGIALTFINFDVVWRYFAWTNQALASVVLWCIVVYLYREKANYWVALIPAVFMTYICSSFVFVSNQFVGLGATPLAYILGGVLTIALTALMCYKLSKERR